jgi:hypothetical protein
MQLDISFKDVRQCLRFTLGLAIYACGTYALVKTDLGLAPWEIFAMGALYHYVKHRHEAFCKKIAEKIKD